jgi:hypothetical protein
MSVRDELVVLALLSTLTLAGALLWAREGVGLWHSPLLLSRRRSHRAMARMK